MDRFDADLAAMAKEIGDPQEQAKRFARYAAEEIEEARQINRRALGKDVAYSVAVDGREGAALTSVRANSVVIAEWRLVEEALEWIGKALVEASPVLTGRYANSHVLFANGVEVRPGEAIPAGATDFVFVNVQPYARKIERGLSHQATHGVYQTVAALAGRRFKDVAAIKYGFETVSKAPAGADRAERKAEQAARNPAIFVRSY